MQQNKIQLLNVYIDVTESIEEQNNYEVSEVTIEVPKTAFEALEEPIEESNII